MDEAHLLFGVRRDDLHVGPGLHAEELDEFRVVDIDLPASPRELEQETEHHDGLARSRRATTSMCGFRTGIHDIVLPSSSTPYGTSNEL